MLGLSCETDSIDLGSIIFDDNETEIISSINKLGFSILKEINSDNNNISISPLSTSISITALYNGCDENTKYKIAKFLDLNSLNTDEINNSYKKILESFAANSSSTNLQYKNSLWIDNNIDINSTYSNLAKFFLNTEIKNINFNTCIKDSINNWAMLNSRTSIFNNFYDNEIETNQIIYANASFYNLSWEHNFHNSYNESFYITDDNIVQTKYMNTTETYDYLSFEDMEIVSIPSDNSNYNVVIILPKQTKTINDILTKLNCTNWEAWNSKFERKTINLSIPYLEIEYSTNLTDILESIGLDNTLEENNFSAISNSLGDLSSIIFGSNKVIFSDSNAIFSNTEQFNTSETISLCINKPFFYAIKENSSNCIIFNGLIYAPQNIN